MSKFIFLKSEKSRFNKYITPMILTLAVFSILILSITRQGNQWYSIFFSDNFTSDRIIYYVLLIFLIILILFFKYSIIRNLSIFALYVLALFQFCVVYNNFMNLLIDHISYTVPHLKTPFIYKTFNNTLGFNFNKHIQTLLLEIASLSLVILTLISLKFFIRFFEKSLESEHINTNCLIKNKKENEYNEEKNWFIAILINIFIKIFLTYKNFVVYIVTVNKRIFLERKNGGSNLF